MFKWCFDVGVLVFIAVSLSGRGIVTLLGKHSLDMYVNMTE